DVGVNYDLGLTLRNATSLARGATLVSQSAAPVWDNGTRRSPTESGLPISSGDLLYRTATGPLLLSDIESGVLAGWQWMNGDRAFLSEWSGTPQSFSRASRSFSKSGTLALSLDGRLTSDLDNRVDAFLRRNGGYLADMSVLVADAVTGDVRALS